MKDELKYSGKYFTDPFLKAFPASLPFFGRNLRFFTVGTFMMELSDCQKGHTEKRKEFS